jgi:uncharacterized protein with PIN domain
MSDTPKFVVDHNVGKLARWLRLMGYDARFFRGESDADTRIMQRRLVTKGRLKALLIESDQPMKQIRQLIDSLKLDRNFNPFSLCLECNQPLVERKKAELKDLVPPYVFKTQEQFRQCPKCHRIYWRGTHWRAMTKRLEGLEDE